MRSSQARQLSGTLKRKRSTNKTNVVLPAREIIHHYGLVYTKGTRRYLHAVWPLIYTMTPFLSQKTIISKQGNRRFCIVTRWSLVCLAFLIGRLFAPSVPKDGINIHPNLTGPGNVQYVCVSVRVTKATEIYCQRGFIRIKTTGRMREYQMTITHTAVVFLHHGCNQEKSNKTTHWYNI